MSSKQCPPIVKQIPENEIKVDLAAAKYEGSERDCRICHLGLESCSNELGFPIQLGCSCKDDLAIAHENCAEAWFNIRGNKKCEICHSIASNVTGPIQSEESVARNVVTATEVSSVSASVPFGESDNVRHGQCLFDACMVFLCVITVLWLWHLASR